MDPHNFHTVEDMAHSTAFVVYKHTTTSHGTRHELLFLTDC